MHTTHALGALGALLLLQLTLPAQSLTTVFTGGNSLNSPGSNVFDLTVLNPNGIVVTSFDVNCENSRNGPIGSLFQLDVYLTARGGSYVGNETNAAAWRKQASGTANSAALNTACPVDVSDFFLPPGSYGIALQFVIPTGSPGTAFSYTNGNGTNQTAANNDLSLSLGASVTGFFVGPVYTPRVWNGTIHYEAGTTAAYGAYGSGCAGGSPTGAPTLQPGTANPLPRLGGPFDLEVGNLGPVPCGAVMAFGLSVTQWGPFALPLDLTMFGMPGCTGYVSLDAFSYFANLGTGSVVFTMGIPNNPAIAGLALGNQALILDPTATNAAGVNATNLAAGRLGM